MLAGSGDKGQEQLGRLEIEPRFDPQGRQARRSFSGSLCLERLPFAVGALGSSIEQTRLEHAAGRGGCLSDDVMLAVETNGPEFGGDLRHCLAPGSSSLLH